MQIEDKHLDTFMILISSLKEGIVKSIHVDESNSHKEAKEYFQSSIKSAMEDIETGKSNILRVVD